MRLPKQNRWRRFKDWWRWSWLGQRWSQFKDWAWCRRSTVKPRWLGHGYCDPDHLLTNLVFEVLGRFLEDPREAGVIDWEASGSDYLAAKRELDDHWRWWNEVYLKEVEQAYDSDAAGLPPFVSELVQLDLGGEQHTVWQRKYESPEDQQRWKEWAQTERQRETAREEELKRRLKRIIDLKEFLWS